MKQAGRLGWSRMVLLSIAVTGSGTATAGDSRPASPKAGYVGCYSLAFTSWRPSGGHKAPHVPPAVIELSRTTGNVGSRPQKVIPPYDPKLSPDIPQFTYWKQGDAGELIIVWGTGLSGLAIFLQRSPDSVLRGSAEILYDDGGRHRSDATATPIDCGTMP